MAGGTRDEHAGVLGNIGGLLMRHYHGTPFGGTRVAAIQFARRRFLFVPWLRTELLDVAMEVSAGFACDNSAFSFWSTGEKPKWKRYADWVLSLHQHPKFDWAIIPDVVEGTEDENNDLIAKWHKWLPPRVAMEGVPVWHMHESLRRLAWLIDHYNRIAIGSSGRWPTPGREGWHERMAEAMGVLCDDQGRPKVKIHGLRMLSVDIVEQYPFASCDSTNCARNKVREAGTNDFKVTSDGMEFTAARIESVHSPAKYAFRQFTLPLFQGDVV